MARIIGANALRFIGPLPEFHRVSYRLSPALKIEIIHLYRNGLTAYAIANQLRISVSSANRWIARYNEERNLEVHKPSGRPRITDEEEDFLLVCTGCIIFINSDFRKCLLYIYIYLAAVNNFDNTLTVAAKAGLGHLSIQSITRRLSDAGILSQIAAVKDILTDAHRAARLHFARQYVNMPLEFWRWVIFTDEKCWSSAAHGRIRVLRQKNKRYNRENILEVKVSGRTSVTVWAGMWLGGVTPLVRVQGNLTAVQYTNILDTVLIPYIDENFPQIEPTTIVQDK